MSENYFYKMTARYIINILINQRKASREAKELCILIYEQCPFYNFKRSEKCPEEAESPDYHIKKMQALIVKWEKCRIPKEIKRLVSLKTNLALDDVEFEIIKYSYIIYYSKFLYVVVSRLSSTTDSKTPSTFFSMILSLSKKDIERKCLSSRKIFILGLAELERNNLRFLEDIISIPNKLLDWIESDNSSDILQTLVSKPLHSKLTSDDFVYCLPQIQFIQKLLDNALSENLKGINILLYGEPGTGKTEFCKMLGEELNKKIYSVGEGADNSEFHEISRDQRLYRLNLANHLLKGKNSIILFDEMEDLLNQGYGFAKESKIFMNRLLENNAVPTIWISNQIHQFDPAFLRRMSFIFELKKPPLQAREETWKKIIGQNHLSLKDEEIKLLASRYDDPPAFAVNAIKAAKMNGGSKEDIVFALDGLRKATGRPSIPAAKTCFSSYNATLNNTDIDLGKLAHQLSNEQSRRDFSLCLYGASGTGKSAYARYLAKSLGLEVLHLRASNLISPFVGETEKNIACAFENALENQSVLVFDEADSFLQDRQGARHSWEITAVNEMLTWMEAHPYPFVCTTNLMERIDSAALRRFTFKVNFEFLSDEQKKMAYEHFFGLKAPKVISGLDYLTPGDFAVVKKKASIMGVLNNPGSLLNMLAEENKAKNIGSNPIGFMT